MDRRPETMLMSRVSLVIAAHNEGERLWKTIGSCVEHSTGRGAEEIVVADDASDDGSIEEALRRFPQIRVVRQPERQGASPTKALGAQHATGEVLVFLDGHCLPERGAVARLVDDVERLHGRAVITPAVPALDVQRWRNKLSQVGHGYVLNLEDFGCGWRPLNTLRRVREQGRDFYESPALIGCAVAVSRDLYEDLRGFDAHMHIWGVEDLDFGLKCWLMGFPILHDPIAQIGHRFREAFDNYQVPTEHVVANQLRMARKQFTPAVWSEWVDRCRQRCAGRLSDHPEGLWARAWTLFEEHRASAEAERAYLHARRQRDEFWFAERFGLNWPRLQGAGTAPTATPATAEMALFSDPSPSPPPCDCELTGLSVNTEVAEVGETLVWTAEGTDLTCLTWDLLERPASSQATLQVAGESASVTTDEPGDYVVGVGCNDVFLNAQATAFRVRVLRGGQAVHDTSQYAIAGERVSLIATISPGRPGVTFNWTVPGDAVFEYNMSLEEGKVEPLTPARRQNPSINIHWIDRLTDGSVQVDVGIAGQTIQKAVNFNVSKPTGSVKGTTTTHDPAVSVQLRQHSPTEPLFQALSYGGHIDLDTFSFGITIEGHIADNTLPSGSIALVQLIDAVYEYRLMTGERFRSSTGHEFVVDPDPDPALNPPPFIHSIVTSGALTPDHVTTFPDAPHVSCDSSMDYVKLSVACKTYLMFRPSGANSIWVSLTQLNWSCAGDADYNPDRNPKWQTIQSVHHENPEGFETSTLPQWEGNFLDFPFQPVDP